jgi:hypothetical protein
MYVRFLTVCFFVLLYIRNHSPWLVVPSRMVDSQTKHKPGYNVEAHEYYPERGGKVRRCAARVGARGCTVAHMINWQSVGPQRVIVTKEFL